MTLNADELAEVEAARKAEHERVTAEWTPRVVRAEFKAAAKGVLTEAQLVALLEDVDLSKYLDEKGAPDDEKIAKKIATVVPAQGRRGLTGYRTTPVVGVPKPGDQGRAMAEKRFGKKTATNE